MSHRFKKRERTQNWSPEEKILLLKLCEDRLDVLESKRGDQISIAKKGNAWKEIRGEFVATLGIERDVSRLKEQWQRMKCQARADLQDFAMRLKKYGPDIANQKRPNQMSAEVWRVMESARKYFLHMNGTESEEDPSTKEINWSLSEANCAASPTPSECDTAPSLLCETEVKTSAEDLNVETNINYLFPYHHFNGLLAECPSPGGLVTEQAKLEYYAKRDYVLAALANAQQQQQHQQQQQQQPQQNNIKNERTDNNNHSSSNNNININEEKPTEDVDLVDDDEDVVHSLTMFLDTKKIEQQKRLQLMDEQMKTAKLNRETAELQKQIAQQQLKNAVLRDKDRTKLNGNLSQNDHCYKNAHSREDDDYEDENRKRVKEDIKEKLMFHEEQIRLHQEAINKHKQRLLEYDATCGIISETEQKVIVGFNTSDIHVWALGNKLLQCNKVEGNASKITLGCDIISGVTNTYENNSLSNSGAAVLRGHGNSIQDIKIVHETEVLLSVSLDKTMRAWKLADNSCAAIYRGHNYPIWCLDVSAFGMYIATGSSDRTARLWTLDRIYPIRILAGHTKDVNTLNFHPNASYFATGSADKTIRMWSISESKTVRLLVGNKGIIYTVAFSPDGQYLASGGDDKTICIWDLTAAKQLTELNGCTNVVSDLTWSKDGKHLAAISFDGNVCVWDTNSVIKQTVDASGVNHLGVCSVYNTERSSLLSINYDKNWLTCLAAASAL